MSRWYNKALAIGAVVSFVLVVIGVIVLSNQQIGPLTGLDAPGLIRTNPPAPAGAEIVHVGIVPTSVYDVDLSTGTWYMNFELWYRWKGPIDPARNSTLENQAEPSQTLYQHYRYVNASGEPSPIVLPDGSFYQEGTISAKFANDFDVARFPVDNQNLSFLLESDSYTKNVVYVVDRTHLPLNSTVQVGPWGTGASRLLAIARHPNTNYGQIGTTAGWHSGIVYSIAVGRSNDFFLGRMLFPLLIVIFAGFVTLRIHPRHFDTRVVTLGSTLLALIFLQLSYGSDLPSPAPLTLMDAIYVISYLATFVLFVRVTLSSTRYKQHEQNEELIAAHDLTTILATVFGFLTLCAIAVATFS